MNHQEIEFTFESDRPEDLYLLQTRDTVVWRRASIVPAFAPAPALERARVAAGDRRRRRGAQRPGRPHAPTDVAELRDAPSPATPVILLRPDTVPDDIALVLARRTAC